jgi:hypothetical protein
VVERQPSKLSALQILSGISAVLEGFSTGTPSTPPLSGATSCDAKQLGALLEVWSQLPGSMRTMVLVCLQALQRVHATQSGQGVG